MVQGNRYDKILKENFDSAFRDISRDVFGLAITRSSEITTDIQHTIERKPDVLRKVVDKSKRTYILHIEIQTRNDRSMVYRMIEYRVMLQRKYKLPVKQYVLYIGGDEMKMITGIDEEGLKFSYKACSLKDIDYKTFLKADSPEERILAVLADYGEDSAEQVILKIIDSLKGVNSPLDINKYYTQLRILAQLRNIDKIKFDTIMFSVSDFFKVERDPYYKVGMAKGMAKGIEKGIEKGEVKGMKKGIKVGREEGQEELKRNLAAKMKNDGHSPEYISKLMGLSLSALEKLH